MAIEISDWEKNVLVDSLEFSIRGKVKEISALEDLDDIEAAVHVLETEITLLRKINGV